MIDHATGGAALAPLATPCRAHARRCRLRYESTARTARLRVPARRRATARGTTGSTIQGVATSRSARARPRRGWRRYVLIRYSYGRTSALGFDAHSESFEY